MPDTTMTAAPTATPTLADPPGDIAAERPSWLQARRLRRALNLEDFEGLARRHLPRPVFGYVSAAAESRVSLRRNRESFAEWAMVTRVLVNVTRRRLDTALLGRDYAAPFGIAPMGISALSAYRGDLVLARAAARANIPMVVSSSSLIRLEEMIRVNPRAWFQAYLDADDAMIGAMIDRVERAGYETLVITVDTPVNPNKENYVKAGFSTPLKPTLRLAWDGITRPAWTLGTFGRTLLRHGMPHFENNYATRGVAIVSRDVQRSFADRGGLDWGHFSRIRDRWRGKLIIKGVLHAKDAALAAGHGADGVVVSNHGGRQLDGAAAPLEVLPGIVKACPNIPVMLDGGVRRGTDVLKALALGAAFVWVGRPFNYAASIAGDAGVDHAIGLLLAEVSRDMAMLGVTSPAELSAEEHLIRVS